MKWQAYPKNKDSGIEWLGEIPKEWEVKRLKYCTSLINKKVEGSVFQLPYTGLENIESWTGRLIQNEEPITSEGQSNLFKSGDVLFGKLRPYLAKVLRARHDGICTGELLVIRPKDITSDFLFNYMLAQDFISIVDSSTYGAKMPRANWDFISNLPMLLPQLKEQQPITSFLDRETSRIDKLISKKERQIELLQEKHVSLISHAVTKGLDPNARMKDSGIDWLGKIPERWGIKQLKYCSPLINEKVNGSITELPYTGLENIEPWTGRLIQNEEPTTSEGQSNIFKSGDVLFGKLRPYLAKVFRARQNGICSSELLVLRPNDITSDFLFYYMLDRDIINIVDSSTYGAKMPRANWDFISNLPMLLPPLKEQRIIVGFLENETRRINALIDKIRKSIDMLHEYRTALISAAVTGKIDLRVEVE